MDDSYELVFLTLNYAFAFFSAFENFWLIGFENSYLLVIYAANNIYYLI